MKAPYENDQGRRLIFHVIIVLVLFVFFHSFMPSDARVHAGFKHFQVEWGLSLTEIGYAVKKWRHLLWFALFFPLVRALFAKQATMRAVLAIAIVTFLIELQQSVIAGRHARLADALPNILGSLGGALAFEFWKRHRRGANAKADGRAKQKS